MANDKLQSEYVGRNNEVQRLQGDLYARESRLTEKQGQVTALYSEAQHRGIIAGISEGNAQTARNMADCAISGMRSVQQSAFDAMKTSTQHSQFAAQQITQINQNWEQNHEQMWNASNDMVQQAQNFTRESLTFIAGVNQSYCNLASRSSLPQLISATAATFRESQQKLLEAMQSWNVRDSVNALRAGAAALQIEARAKSETRASAEQAAGTFERFTELREMKSSVVSMVQSSNSSDQEKHQAKLAVEEIEVDSPDFGCGIAALVADAPTRASSPASGRYTDEHELAAAYDPELKKHVADELFQGARVM
jgi:hypothetical protein